MCWHYWTNVELGLLYFLYTSCLSLIYVMFNSAYWIYIEHLYVYRQSLLIKYQLNFLVGCFLDLYKSWLIKLRYSEKAFLLIDNCIQGEMYTYVHRKMDSYQIENNILYIIGKYFLGSYSQQSIHKAYIL